jgi:3-oxoadipate enol-lactonase
MPYVNLPDGARIFYRVDDFTDPWSQPETILMLHGFCRNSRFWYAWVPILGRHFRVVRPDLPRLRKIRRPGARVCVVACSVP